MKGENQKSQFWSRLLWILLLLLPLAVLFLMPGRVLVSGGIWFLLTFLLSILLVRVFLGPAKAEPVPPPEIRLLEDKDEPGAVRDVMDVRVATEEAGIKVSRGRLLVSASNAYERLKTAFRGEVVPMLLEDETAGTAIVLAPDARRRGIPERPIQTWVHWLLFGLTLVTHELGHYFTARKHDMRVTPPYFIPVPFALGTFGAFIQKRSPAENRKALLMLRLLVHWPDWLSQSPLC